MAEAHSAIAVRFTVTDDGVQFNIDHELFRALMLGFVASFRRRLAQMMNKFENGIYPASPFTLFFTTVIIALLYHFGVDPSWGYIDKGAGLCEWFWAKLSYDSGPTSNYLFGLMLFSVTVWLVFGYIGQFLLRYLLSFQFWIYESINDFSSPTVVLFSIVRAVCLSKPHLFSYQQSLPRLPVPTLQNTVRRYLASVKPLLTPEQYSRMENLARDFERGVGPKLQWYLHLKSWWSSNYISDWWEEFVYLRGRSPIMINSNIYGMELFYCPRANQAARAANVVCAMIRFRRKIDMEQLQPVLVRGVVPLCNKQYERQFNTTRIPGIETDKLVHYQESKHVAVYHRGRYFKVPIQYRGTTLKPAELELLFQKVLDDQSLPASGEHHLAALTAGPRADWARARNLYFASGRNKASLDAIEKAAFVVVLDDEVQDYIPEDCDSLPRMAKSLLHGHCYDRWFDKSFNLVVFRNGRVGVNAEHSWGDAPITGHMIEWSFLEDHITLGYTSAGNTQGVPRFTPPPPARLQWDLCEAANAAIEQSLTAAQQLVDDLEMEVFIFKDYGKGLAKKCNLSPDGWMQMALQLAFYRDIGTFCLTYEASMTRLFAAGRTETVRSCSDKSCLFVKAMVDPNSSRDERVQLLRDAIEYHRMQFCDAMIGRGCDRHLFALYVVARYKHWVSAFLEDFVQQRWRLSTSQTSAQQTDRVNLKANPEYCALGGGFGPVSDDGYGVSYIISGENLVSFHISAKRSCKQTDTRRFGQNIRQAMLDMRDLFAAPPAAAAAAADTKKDA